MERKIFDLLVSLGIPETLANFIVGQARHETGNFTSNVFKDCKNLFGYSAVPGAKKCTGHSFYKAYNNTDESVIELVGWIKRRQNEGKFPKNLNEIKTPEQYANLLKSANYYEDSAINYGNGIKRFMTNYKAEILGIGSIFFISLVLIVLLRKKK